MHLVKITAGLLGFGMMACQNPRSKHPDPEALFVHEIKPLMEQKCLACHGDPTNDIEGNFDIRSLAGLLEGGESGHAALVPGQPQKSPIFQAVTRKDPDFAMPPKENDKLTEAQVFLLEQWIASGAPWPDSTRQAAILERGDWDYADGIQVATSGGLSDSWTQRRYIEADLWAYQPLKNVAAPTEGGNPIDAFIEDKLDEVGLKPAPQADKATLIRRASFDLLGLPPTPAEVTQFLADEDVNAFDRLIDRLLASPHYGEQWGRHWLDVARYADSDGFSNDYARPSAWRYRDYVIRSFNEDKPYDQFVKEQLAGDEIDPNDPEMLVAVGFLRMGPWEHTGMSVAAETRQFFLDDVTNSVGETFFATPLRCARCHDHKFDPIPTRDYYRIQAVFASTQFAQREAAFLSEENAPLKSREKEQILQWIENAESEREAITKKEEDAAKAWYRKHGKPYKNKKQRYFDPDEVKPPRFHGLTFQDLGYRKVLNKRMQSLRRELDRYGPWAYSVYNGPTHVPHSARSMRMPKELEGAIDTTHILQGGSVYAPIDPVHPGVLSAVSLEEAEIPLAAHRRRLAFAHWLVQENQALTARTMVNRIWQYHFGKGLAENPNNLGVSGKKPTHPELLDWLAQYFIDQNWSIKAVHRLIMSSDTYQRSSQPSNRDKLDRLDPNRELYTVFLPRRLTAEEIRDAMLFVSGELNPEMGGIPIRPEIHPEVALQPRHIMGSIARAYQASPTPAERNRRTIYAQRLRGLPDPALEVFNQPGPDLSCERRSSSTVTPQVFAQFNGIQTRNRALAMALRLEKEAHDLETQLQQAMELAWNRKATQKELDLAIAYADKMNTYHEETPPTKQEFPLQITRTMFEEMTGEPFSFVEKLDVYDSYVPDPQPNEVSFHTRALADVCAVLFNSNEFMYVY